MLDRIIKGRVLPHIPGVFYMINSEPNDLRMNIEFPKHARRKISGDKMPSWVLSAMKSYFVNSHLGEKQTRQIRVYKFARDSEWLLGNISASQLVPFNP